MKLVRYPRSARATVARSRLAVVLLPLLLAGCVLAPGDPRINPDRNETGSVTEDLVDRVFITPELISAYNRRRLATQGMSAEQRRELEEYEYRVGPGDILTVIVYDHPELTIPAGPERSAEQAGNLVRPDGTIFYPFIGELEVEGHTTSEIRDMLEVRLASYLNNPQIDVLVARFASKKIYVTGAVRDTTVIPITDVPLTVLEALTGAGLGAQGFGGGNVGGLPDFHNVSLVRDGELIRLNIYNLLWEGDMSQNLLLQNGDVINIPQDVNQIVSVLGQVRNPTTFTNGVQRLSLSDALSRAGGLDDTSARPSGVFVLRPRPQDDDKVATVYQLDLRQATGLMLAAQFPVIPKDVVFVTTAPLERWNRVIDLLTPSLDFPGDIRGSRDDIEDLF